jgi:L,D-peptidoglycan transpeptidase YkuD (ErfK/YbiS/YcfS/YnhG family)
MIIFVKNKETLNYDDYQFKCCVGKNGIIRNKIEGDKKTPKGIFEIGNLYFRGDKNKKPLTNLKSIKIKKNMGWCDDKNNEKNYNKLIKINKKIKYEKLYRLDDKYDFMIPILYNTDKRILGKGSAIFIHLTKNYNGTDGCIALKKSDFLILLKLIKPNTKIKII